MLASRRILFVHAHPDDETINNGATMAKYVAEGAHVTLITCTRGEEGEVLVEELAHLASHRDQAHRVAMRAAELSRPQWEIQKIYWNVMPKSELQKGIDKMKELGSSFFGIEKVEDFPFAKDDALVSARVDGVKYVHQKMAAMKAHPTQMSLDGPFFALSNQLGIEVMADEFYTLVYGTKSQPFDEKGRETDLFNGITLI